MSYAKKAKPPTGDKDEIKRMAERDFETIVALWKDEDYEKALRIWKAIKSYQSLKGGLFKKDEQQEMEASCAAVDGAKETKAIHKSPASVYIKAIMGYKSVVKEMKRHDTFKLTLRMANGR